MSKIFRLFWFLLPFFYSLSAQAGSLNFDYSLNFVEQSLPLNVVLALNQQERERGLMQQPHLAENQGMLFVYSKQTNQDMWMKNMLISLDVLFLDQTGRIVSLLIDLPPCQREPCKIYASHSQFTYMLEVHAGFVNKHHVEIGQMIALPKNLTDD